MKTDANNKPTNPRWIICVKGLCPWPEAPHEDLEDFNNQGSWNTWHKVPKRADREYHREAQHGYEERVYQADQYGVHFNRPPIPVELIPPVPPKPNLFFRSIDQDFWWKNRDGVWVMINKMPNPYRYNILAYMERHAKEWLWLYVKSEINYYFENTWALSPDDAYDPAQPIDVNDPVGWIRETTLYRGIKRGIV